MCISSQIKKIQAEKEALDAKIRKLEELEGKTEPIKQALYQLFEDYRNNAPEHLTELLAEIAKTCDNYDNYDSLVDSDPLGIREGVEAEFCNPDEDEATFSQEKAAAMTLLQNSMEKAVDRCVGNAFGKQPSLRLEELTAKSVLLTSKGFFQPEGCVVDYFDDDDKYETYRNWDLYFSVPNGGVVAIGLHNAQRSQFWDCSTEVVDEFDKSFPESLADYDDIVKWTRNLIDQIENLEAPGQLVLSLVFPDEPTDEQIEEELGCNWEDEGDAPPKTKLQELLEVKDHFVFGNLHIGVKIKSVFVENEIDYEGTDEGDDPATEQIEHALFEVSDFSGQSRSYYKDCESLFYKYQGLAELEKAALEYAENFWRELKEENKIAEILARGAEVEQDNKVSESAKPETETDFEAMGYTVKVYPQLSMGVTFRFLNADKTVAFSNSLTTPEINGRSTKVCAWDLIAAHREKERNRGKQDPSMVAANIDPNEAFVELVKISNSVGYLKRKDNGEMFAGYAAFSNKTPNGDRTQSSAKRRAQKWADYLAGTFRLICEVRKARRITSDISVMPFVYEIKIEAASIGQLQKLAEEDFSLLPNEVSVSTTVIVEQSEAKKVLPTKYTVKVNSYIVAAGTEEDGVRDRFEQELLLLGGATGNHTVSLLAGGDIIQSFNKLDFEFVGSDDFDSGSPEYLVRYASTEPFEFNVWMTAVTRKWRHSYSVTGDEKYFETREAAAVDAVRAAKLKT